MDIIFVLQQRMKYRLRKLDALHHKSRLIFVIGLAFIRKDGM